MNITDQEWNQGLILACGANTGGSTDISNHLLGAHTFPPAALGTASLAAARRGDVALVRRLKALGAVADTADGEANLDMLVWLVRSGDENLDHVFPTMRGVDRADVLAAYIVAGMDLYRELSPDVIDYVNERAFLSESCASHEPMPIVYAAVQPHGPDLLTTMAAAGVSLSGIVSTTGLTLQQYYTQRVEPRAANEAVIALLRLHQQVNPPVADGVAPLLDQQRDGTGVQGTVVALLERLKDFKLSPQQLRLLGIDLALSVVLTVLVLYVLPALRMWNGATLAEATSWRVL